VSTYNKLYNWTWLYNGFHAEHHYRPKVHWTKMVELRERNPRRAAGGGVHVMSIAMRSAGWITHRPRYTMIRPKQQRRPAEQRTAHKPSSRSAQ
jgi:fatty acid desaturase